MYLLCELLNSAPCQQFLASIVFHDAKRPITAEVLRRISLVALARRLGRLNDLAPYLRASNNVLESNEIGQLSLVMEETNEYSTNSA